MNLCKLTAVFMVSAALIGCHHEPKPNPVPLADDISQQDIDRLREKRVACGAGEVRSISADIQIDVIRALRGDVDFSADARNALAAAIFENADLTNDNVLAAYEIYERCLRELEF